MVTGIREKGKCEIMFNGYRVLVWEEKKVLEMDGDG